MNDKQKQKILNKLNDYTMSRYGGVVAQLTSIQVLLPKLYGEGVVVPQEWLNGLLEEIIKLDTNQPTTSKGE